LDERFNHALGARLRAARRRRGLSLNEVEELSGREFKASVLGAYERGDRTISVPRLVRLSSIYDIAVQNLIPAEITEETPDAETTIDLDEIAEDSELVDRFLSAIQLMRRTPGDAASVRRSDLAVLSSLISTVPQRDPN
jgi:transcriptional regulator with XRE-family HTH domain